MAPSDIKTTWTGQDVMEFLQGVNDKKRVDALKLIELMEKESGWQPKMWGPSIIGFGAYHYKYESGHEGDAPVIAFSPRKAAITLYLMPDPDNREEMLARLGKHKITKACIYVNKLADVNLDVIREMVHVSIDYVKNNSMCHCKTEQAVAHIAFKKCGSSAIARSSQAVFYSQCQPSKYYVL